MSVPAAPLDFPLSNLTRLVRVAPTAIGHRLRWSGSVVRKCEAQGLTWRQADRAAMAFGFHPAEVWPNWFVAEDLAA